MLTSTPKHMKPCYHDGRQDQVSTTHAIIINPTVLASVIQNHRSWSINATTKHHNLWQENALVRLQIRFGNFHGSTGHKSNNFNWDSECQQIEETHNVLCLFLDYYLFSTNHHLVLSLHNLTHWEEDYWLGKRTKQGRWHYCLTISQAQKPSK